MDRLFFSSFLLKKKDVCKVVVADSEDSRDLKTHGAVLLYTYKNLV